MAADSSHDPTEDVVHANNTQERAEAHIPASVIDTRLEKSIPKSESGDEKNDLLCEKRGDKQQQFISGFKRAQIVLPITLVYFLVMLDTSIISTAVPKITDEFDSLLDVGWYGSAYQLASSAFVPLAGKVYTYFPTKVIPP